MQFNLLKNPQKEGQQGSSSSLLASQQRATMHLYSAAPASENIVLPCSLVHFDPPGSAEPSQPPPNSAAEIAPDKPVSWSCRVTDQSQKIALVSNAASAVNTLRSPRQALERPLWLLQVKPGAWNPVGGRDSPKHTPKGPAIRWCAKSHEISSLVSLKRDKGNESRAGSEAVCTPYSLPGPF